MRNNIIEYVILMYFRHICCFAGACCWLWVAKLQVLEEAFGPDLYKSYWDSTKRGLFGDGWWYQNLRMSRRTFVALCSILDPRLRKQATRLRMPVDVDEQVAVTLWRLASNIEYRTISQLFGLGISTVCTIHSVCVHIQEAGDVPLSKDHE